MSTVPNIENEIYTKLKAALVTADPDVNCGSVMEDRPAKFPFVSIVMTSETTYQRSSTFDNKENHVQFLMEVNIFTNDLSGKKERAKKLMAVAKTFLCETGENGGLGMLCTQNQPIVNAADTNIHRRVGRFEGVVGNDKVIYWR